MRIKIEEDERWPDYDIVDVSSTGTEVNVDARKVQRWSKVIAEYNAVQQEMQDVVVRTVEEWAEK